MEITQSCKLPIGIQDFEDLRRKGFLYVDKTEYVWRLVTEGKPYFLSRPRRFGKSLFLTTLKAYFQGKKELFDGLAIAERETAWREYPVLHLDFNPSGYGSAASLTAFIRYALESWER
ncbi:MAG: AAA family ATPase, partial [Spirochaetaceae bacterium]|nr:AAA family ATPase [Spirochaetaceae bacterium]